MMPIRFSYVNYEHGGRTKSDATTFSNPYEYSGDGGAFDFDRLARIMADGEWPDILVMGEGDRYEYNGGEGGFEAARAMRAVGGPAYLPLLGSLPREGGPFAPMVFVNPQLIDVHRWYDHRCADFASRNRNLLVASRVGEGEPFRVVAVHGDIHDEERRLADAREFDRFANPTIPCVILGDWNSTPSGPMWEVTDLDDDIFQREPWRKAWRQHWEPGAQVGPCRDDTRALDYLCGTWMPGEDGAPGARVNGIGFWDVAELAGDGTPTQLPRRNGRQPRCIDRALLNGSAMRAYVRHSYHVHQPRDPERPDSDHLRISFAVDL